jgi:hypothetical protein
MPLLQRRGEKPEKVKGKPVDGRVDAKIKRGRERMLKDSNLRELCVKFFNNEQNYYLGSNGVLLAQNEVTTATGGKPPHRVRNKYNFVRSVVLGKVSGATQRVPSYEVVQSTSDHKDYTAARLAEKVAVYLYDEIHLRRATTKVVTNALVQREGFAMPYFDPNVGPFVPSLDPESGEIEEVGMGQVKILTFNRSEVMWEPGEDFLDSRWHAYEREMLIEEIEKIPGYVGGKVKSDVKDNSDKATLTVYLERPCPDYPDGRRLHICNGQVICPEEEYPLKDYKGDVIDQPVLHRLSYIVDPDGEDDKGLVEDILDTQRTINDCWSKLIEWKNRCLMPQMMAPRGANVTRPDDVPGAIKYYNTVSGQKPEWERPPQVPRELFDMLDLAISHLRALAANVDVQPEPDLAAKTANAAIEQSARRWQSFLGDLAEFHSRLMRACLTLVARHYTDERLIEIRGQYGWETIPDFKGQDLYGQVSTRVRPDSLENKGRQRVLEELQFMQTAYPNSISPEAAWSSLQGGNGEGLLKSFELDVSAAWRLVELLKQGPEALTQLPERFDPDLAVPIPGWMPRKQHNVAIFKQVLADAMKVPEFDKLPPETQHAFDLVWSDLERLEMARAQALAMQAQSSAAELGMANAASPQPEAQLPAGSGPLSPEQAAPA